MQNKHLVLAGAGHTHLHLLKNSSILKKKQFKVTLISPTEFYYNGLAPGVLSNNYSKKIGQISILCHLEKIGCQFIIEKVVGIDVDEKTLFLSNNEIIPYNIVSINIGARGRKLENDNLGVLFPTRPVSELWSFQKKLIKLIEKSPSLLKVVILGAGAAGVEIAGNIHKFISDHNIEPKIILITRGSHLLTQFPLSARTKVIKSFRNRDIQVLLNSEVIKNHDKTIVIANRDEIAFDLGISATGIIPNTIENYNKLETTSNGELIVTKYLQCKGQPTIFAAGDCAYFESSPLWKSGYHAINQGPILLHNILALDKNSKLRPYKPKKFILTALNLGDGTGIVIFGRFTYHGILAFKIKDYIEKRFLKNHQC